jgi:predicted nucleic acid-binding protein
MQRSLFQYVFDSSSLIEIERNGKTGKLRRLRGEVLLPKKVAEEVAQPGTPLRRFISRYSDIISSFQPNEEEEYLRIRSQIGIDDGEASAIALALNRNLPLVIEDIRGRTKAQNHKVECLHWQEFFSK